MGYTKTASFIFPLLEISKKDLYATNRSGRTSSAFVNAYLVCEKRPEYIPLDVVFVVLDTFQDRLFESRLVDLRKKDNFVEEFWIADHPVLVFTIPEKHKDSAKLLYEGKYSKVDSSTRRLLIGGTYFEKGGNKLTLVFSKSTYFKQYWESKMTHIDPVDIGDSEVWPIIKGNEIDLPVELYASSSELAPKPQNISDLFE